MDQIILIFSGSIFIIAGIGFALAKIDESAKKKDEKRFGPLCNINMGLGYTILRNKFFKILIIFISLGIGICFILNGLGLFN